MKTIYLLIVFLTIQNLTAFSQTFEVRDSLQLEVDNIIEGQWADINNDGFLNYVALLKKADSIEIGYFSIANDIANYTEIFSKKCLDAQFQMADFTQDGLLDIILSLKTLNGNSLEIYTNNDALALQAEVVDLDSVYTYNLLTLDINRNGSKEILALTENISGEFEPKIYSYQLKTMKWDTLSIAFSEELTYKEILNIDINKDGWDDILISGINTNGEAVLEFYKNNYGEFERTEHNFDYPELLKLSKADLDADGDFDIIFSGKVTGGFSLFYYENNIETFKKGIFGIDPDSVLQIFSADFNSDGFIDIVLKSNTAGTPLNKLMLNDGNRNFTFEEVKMTDYQDFGDWDWDGDLDIIQFTKKGDSVNIFLLKNITLDKNNGPNNPINSLAFPQNKKVTISWDSVQDDYTNHAAITYDLYITKEKVTVSPGFDIEKTHRIVVAHGNQNTLTTTTYYELESGIYNYGIQAVDNSFYAGGESGNCYRGQFVICDNLKTHTYLVCDSEELILVPQAGKEGNWYSSVNGDLGITDSLKITITESEEIYFAIQSSLDCLDQEVWSFEVMESGDIELLPDIWVCEGEGVEIDVGDFWELVQWESSQRGNLGDSSILTFIVDKPDTITVRLESYQGCNFEDEFTINISAPQITMSGEVFRILKGESVRIIAGGGTSYEWAPIEGLNNHLIPNPIASPEKSILYTVEVTDSIGCLAVGTVQIIIETNAFIPNLFTPNQDQLNDELKIYGLEEVDKFTFKIYSRTGSLVYESSDISDVTNRGWDGTKKGNPLPNGVYYWKISGTYKNGDAVYLNGDSSGAIHLLR